MQMCCCSILRLSNFILIRFQSSRRQAIASDRAIPSSAPVSASAPFNVSTIACFVANDLLFGIYLVNFEEMQLLLGLWMNFTDYHLSRVQKWISLANRATSLRIFMHPICHDISITISGHRGRGAPNTEFDFQQSYSGAASCGLGSCGFLRLCPRVGRCGHQKRDATVTWPAR